MDDDWGPDWRGGWEQQRYFYRKVWTGRSAGSAVPLKLLQGADVRELSVTSIDRVQYFRPRTTY